jgi:predicted amidophosphoribosyltransferase
LNRAVSPNNDECDNAGNGISKSVGGSSETKHGRVLCEDCSAGKRLFERGFSCVEYGSARDILLGLKFSGKAYYAAEIAEMISDRLKAELREGGVFYKPGHAPGCESCHAPGCEPDTLDRESIYNSTCESGKPDFEADCNSDSEPAYISARFPWDIIAPVPMHAAKQRKRGYNQADLIGGAVAASLGIRYEADMIERTRGTTSMSRISGSVRGGNISGAFALRRGGEEAVCGKSVLLIDDIFTTGNTVGACAEALLGAGASNVYFAVFAA